MFVDFFIHRPVFATVASLMIVIAGAIVIPGLPIAQFPDLAPPQVSVTSFYTGANAQAVESSVTTPLEQAINGVPGACATSLPAAATTAPASITVTFDLSRNLDIAAAVDVQNRVSSVTGRLPNEVKTTGVVVIRFNSNFISAIGFYSDGDRFDNEFLSNYLDVYVKDALKRVPGEATCRSLASANMPCACGLTRRAWRPAGSVLATRFAH